MTQQDLIYNVPSVKLEIVITRQIPVSVPFSFQCCHTS